MTTPADAAPDLGETTSIEVLSSLVPLERRSVIDVGCGGMAFSRELVRAGARVLAVDPDPVQAAANRAAESAVAPTFVEAGATALPADDASADGVVFSFSLHHVPEDDHARAFDEALRVLRPDGFLCVIEPIGGPLNDVVRLFHDEEAERAAAWRSLETLAAPRFRRRTVRAYHTPVVFESWAAFVDRFAGAAFNDDDGPDEVDRPEVRIAFEAAGGPGFAFPSRKRLMLLQERTDGR